VPWSTDRTLAETLANLRERIVAFSSILSDVDTPQDYARGRAHTERLIPTGA